MSHIFGCKQTPATPPTTSDEESSGSTDDGEMKKKKGNRAMGKKKYPKAIKYYTKAVKIDPENATYRLNRAIANAALELWKDAEDDAAKAVELGRPASSKGYYQLAKARLRRGNHEEASEALKAGLEAFPQEAALQALSKELDRAVAAREARRKKAEEAEAQRRQLPVGPASVKAFLEQARAAYSGDRLEECARLCASAREAAAAAIEAAGPESAAADDRRREDISVCSLLGRVMMRQRRWEDAVDPLRSSVDLQERVFSMEKTDEREALSNGYNNLGIALKNAGQMPKAVQALNTAYLKATNGDDKVATPQAAQILQNIAQCLVQQGKMDEARAMYSRALEIGQRLFGSDHASHALNHMCIARCLKREGRLPDAIKAYTTAYEIWTSKDPEECLRELPEVPSKERLSQLQEQCRQELAQLVLFAEELRRTQEQPGAEASAPAGEAAPA